MPEERKPVRVERHGGVARVCFDRPESLNALDEATAEAFRDACIAVTGDGTVRAVVVEGAGRAFMAGGDIDRFAATPEKAAAVASAIITPFHQGLLALRHGDAPVVAAVHGVAAGAGLSLMLACDIAIAADDARFVFAYTGIGTSPDGSSSFFLPRVVGLRRALEISLLNEPVTAQRALELGLVNRLAAPAELEGEALALAERLAAGPTRAYGRLRRLYEQSFGASLAEQLEAERVAFMASARTRDFAEGVAAFREKREATFDGR